MPQAPLAQIGTEHQRVQTLPVPAQALQFTTPQSPLCWHVPADEEEAVEEAILEETEEVATQLASSVQESGGASEHG